MTERSNSSINKGDGRKSLCMKLLWNMFQFETCWTGMFRMMYYLFNVSFQSSIFKKKKGRPVNTTTGAAAAFACTQKVTRQVVASLCITQGISHHLSMHYFTKKNMPCRVLFLMPPCGHDRKQRCVYFVKVCQEMQSKFSCCKQYVWFLATYVKHKFWDNKIFKCYSKSQ